MRLNMPDGRVGHAEIMIGDAVIMLADEMEEWGNVSPETLGGAPTSLMVYFDEISEIKLRYIFQRAEPETPQRGGGGFPVVLVVAVTPGRLKAQAMAPPGESGCPGAHSR